MYDVILWVLTICELTVKKHILITKTLQSILLYHCSNILYVEYIYINHLIYI